MTANAKAVARDSAMVAATIGPITATRLGIRTVDVGAGLAQLGDAAPTCVIVGGMAIGTVFTLFVVPTAYTLLSRRRVEHRPEPTAHPQPAE